MASTSDSKRGRREHVQDDRSPKKEDRRDAAYMAIPGGLLFGIGLGFIFNNVPAYTLMGLGAGFVMVIIINKAGRKQK